MTHEGMLWYVAHNQRHWPASPQDRGLIALPLFHKNALRGTVKPMLFAGGSFVLMPAYEPRAYLAALATYRCTYSRGVAAVFTMVLQHRDEIASLDLSALRSMSIGSAVVTSELLDAVERALPGVKTSESYGLTEGGSPFRAPVDGRPVPRGSVGALAPDIEVKLVDAAGIEQPSFGELMIRCPYVCLGYHNQPEVTRAKLQDGWLKTGDIFFKDENGFYYFRSRADDMFSCGGENIYPKEVENLLFRHPDVANAVVAPVPHAVKGFVPAALVIARRDAAVTADGLKAFCLEHGPAFAHPRHVELVDALPLNGPARSTARPRGICCRQPGRPVFQRRTWTGGGRRDKADCANYTFSEPLSGPSCTFPIPWITPRAGRPYALATRLRPRIRCRRRPGSRCCIAAATRSTPPWPRRSRWSSSSPPATASGRMPSASSGTGRNCTVSTPRAGRRPAGRRRASPGRRRCPIAAGTA